MKGWAVGVSVDEPRHILCAHELFDGTLIDIHDLKRFLLVLSSTLIAVLTRSADAFLYGQGQEGLLYVRIANMSPVGLVGLVVSAEGISVAQQCRYATQFDQGRVGNASAACSRREVVAEQEVTVAVHDIDSDLPGGNRLQGLHDADMFRSQRIVTNPDFEQVAEDIKVIRPVSEFADKGKKTFDQLGAFG